MPDLPLRIDLTGPGACTRCSRPLELRVEVPDLGWKVSGPDAHRVLALCRGCDVGQPAAEGLLAWLTYHPQITPANADEFTRLLHEWLHHHNVTLGTNRHRTAVASAHQARRTEPAPQLPLGARQDDDSPRPEVTATNWAAAKILWDYHHTDDPPRPSDAGILLGCHDLGVADVAADLYHTGQVPILVCSGGRNPIRPDQYPHGEAAAFRHRLIELGVPDAAILLEPAATNTSDNITLSRQVLADAGIPMTSVTLICMPYMQRRAYTTCRKQWPAIDITCASANAPLTDYAATIGDNHLVLDHLVGDLQRIIDYPRRGYTIAQTIPEPVMTAYTQLVAAGFTHRMIKRPPTPPHPE